jgi:hypothetical protein
MIRGAGGGIDADHEEEVVDLFVFSTDLAPTAPTALIAPPRPPLPLRLLLPPRLDRATADDPVTFFAAITEVAAIL